MSCVHFILACLSLCIINNCNIWTTASICFVKLKTWWFSGEIRQSLILDCTPNDEIFHGDQCKILNKLWCDVGLEILSCTRQPYRRNCSATRSSISIFPEGWKSYRCGRRGGAWLCQHGRPWVWSWCNFVFKWAISSQLFITCRLLWRVQTILDI